MNNTFWVLAITIFLGFLSLYKYTNKQQLSQRRTSLRSWIEDFVDRILPREVEEDEVVQLEEVQDIIYDFVIRNQNIFSRIKVNNGEQTEGSQRQSRSSETSEGDSKES